MLAGCGPSRLTLGVFEAGWRGAQKIGLNRVVNNDSDNDDNNDKDALGLTPWHVSRLPSFMQAGADTWDSFRLIEAVHLCKAFALVLTDSQDGCVSMSIHPLVHAWARGRADGREQHETCVPTGCLMAVSRGDSELWRQRGRQLQPHLQSLTL